MQVALSLGLGTAMTIETPLMFIDKAATWALAQQLGGDALTALIIGAQPHLLPGRAQRAPPLGLRLRRAVRPACSGAAAMSAGAMQALDGQG